LRSLLSTTQTSWQLPLRLCLFFVFWMHGAQKALGLYHGPGLSVTIHLMGGLGIPVPLALLAVAAEFLGCFGMLFGFLTRVAAFGLCCNMAVAVLVVHLKNGFFLAGPAAGKPPGYEFAMTLFFMALALLIGGAGKLSVDGALAGRRRTAA
jgi:putative oxidoreductase